MVAFGEENRDWGGAFAVYRGLTEALPYHRLFNSPISEAAIVGAAVGYAPRGRPRGGRADVRRFHGPRRRRDLQPALQVAGHVRRRSSPCPSCCASPSAPSTARSTRRTGPRCVHHIPGLKVVYPVTPYDAKGMMNAALAGTDPVVFFESQKVYDFGEMFVEAGVPEGYYEIPLCRAVRQARGQGPDHHHLRPGALHRGRQPPTNSPQQLRPLRRADRPALRQPAQLRAAGRVGAEDRQGPAGLRRGRARLASCRPSPPT